MASKDENLDADRKQHRLRMIYIRQRLVELKAERDRLIKEHKWIKSQKAQARDR